MGEMSETRKKRAVKEAVNTKGESGLEEIQVTRTIKTTLRECTSFTEE
jgi:hypothetical protein